MIGFPVRVVCIKNYVFLQIKMCAGPASFTVLHFLFNNFAKKLKSQMANPVSHSCGTGSV